jgi:protein-disulfide isomerase
MKRLVMAAIFVATSGFAGVAAAQQNEDLTDATLKELLKGQKELIVQLKQINAQLVGIRRDLKAAAPAQRRTARKPDTKVYDVKIGESPFKGPADAAVTIVGFSDLQCPFCIREYPKITQIMKDYPDDVRFVFKNFPLGMHKKAPQAHAAVTLAGQQGKFWEMHDLIVESPKKLDVPDLRAHALKLELDLDRFDEVMKDSKTIRSLYADDMKEALRCKVGSTPTVMINGLKLSGRSLKAYRARIEQILKKKKQAIKKDG